MSAGDQANAREYVAKMRERGRTDEEIRRRMLQHGWREEQLAGLLGTGVPSRSAPQTVSEPMGRRRSGAVSPTGRHADRRAMVWAIAIVLGIIVIASATVVVKGRPAKGGPEEAVAAYIAAVNARDEQAARALLTTESREWYEKQVIPGQQGADRDHIDHFVVNSSRDRCQNITRIGPADINRRSQTASVPCRVGNSATIYFQTKFEDGKWKIIIG